MSDERLRPVMRGGARRAMRRMSVPWALAAMLAGCETVEVAETPTMEEPLETAPAVATPPADQQPPQGAMLVRVHPESLARMPPAATGIVTLVGDSGTRTANVGKAQPTARFDDLPAGRYELSASVVSGGVEVGSYSYPVRVTDALRDVTAPIEFRSADLRVEAVVQPTLRRDYSGTAHVTPEGCIGTESAEAVRSSLSLSVDGSDLLVTINNYQAQALRLSGRIESDSEPFSAAGNYESAGDHAGGWRMSRLAAPTPHTLSTAIEFEDAAQGCQAVLEFIGLADDPGAAATAGSNRAGARIEVFGHGQSREASLEAPNTQATFKDLLIGPYDVFVDVIRGGEVGDRRRESVVLGEGGAQLSTEFQFDYSIKAPEPMAHAAEPASLGQRFQGVSIVSSGSPECTGSTALVDSAQLNAKMGDGVIELSFDNFYGKVLTLAGTLSDVDGYLAASGGYRSSDEKTGSWSMKRIVAPTPRQIALAVEFHNEADACQAIYEFAGLR